MLRTIWAGLLWVAKHHKAKFSENEAVVFMSENAAVCIGNSIGSAVIWAQIRLFQLMHFFANFYALKIPMFFRESFWIPAL